MELQETTERRGFSKAMKSVPVRVEITVRDPERTVWQIDPVTRKQVEVAAPVKMLLGFRRMTDGETTAMQERNATRLATAGQDAQGNGTADLVDVLAPLFVEQRGIDDFPNGDGTPEQRFRRYFLGDGSESAEDLEVEAKIVQAAYLGYLHGAFRLVPAELVSAFSLLRVSNDAVRNVAGNGGGSDVRLPALPKAGKGTRKRGKLRGVRPTGGKEGGI